MLLEENDPTATDSADDETLIRRIQSASSLEDAFAARNELVLKHLRVAKAAARSAVPLHLASFRDDAYQVACCCILELATRYDPASGVPFRWYAFGAMKHRVQEYLRLNRYQARAHRLGYVGNRILKHLAITGAKLDQLSDSRLAAATGLPVRSIKAVRPWLTQTFERDAHGPEDNDEPFGAILADDSDPVFARIQAEEDRRQLLRLVSTLSPKDRLLLTRVFGLDGGEPMSVREAVAALGFSPQRGYVRLKRALRILRSAWRD